MASSQQCLAGSDNYHAAPGPGLPIKGRRTPIISVTLRPASGASLSTVEVPILAVVLLVFTVSALVAPDGTLRGLGTQLPIPSMSPLLRLTGIPCLLCGLTRSFMSMGGLKVGQAFVFHPLGPIFYVMMLLLGGVMAWSLAARRRVGVKLGRISGKSLGRAGAVILVAAWVLKLVVWRHSGLL